MAFFKATAAAAISVAAVASALPAPAAAQAPDVRYHTLETEHFRVTFPEGLEELGRRAAGLAERAHGQLSEAFIEPPGGTIDVLVTDHTDVSNGFAQVTPSNRITVFARPPVDDIGLGYFDDWMELVITHELAHILHLDRAGTLGRILRSVFGRVPGTWPFFPGASLPRWTTEGMATWYESYLTDAGRTHGTYHDLLLRTAVLEGRFDDLGEASGRSPLWPSGNRSYAYGSLFFDHLLEEHGEEKMAEFVEAVAGQWIPYRLDAAGREAFGVSLSDAWREWRRSLEEEAEALEEEVRRQGPVTRARRLTHRGRLALYPQPSPDGSTLAFTRADGRSDAQIRVARPDGAGSRKLTRTNGLATFDWMPDGDLLVSQLEFRGPYRTYGDLYRVGSEGEERRITRGQRLSQPSVSPDGRWAVAAQEGEGTNALVRVDLATGAVSPVVPPRPDVHWAYPALSPDGRWIAVSRWTPGARTDIVVLDLEGEEVLRLTRDRALDLDPAWSPDGRWLLWMSDRTGIPNILAAEVAPEAGEAGEPLFATNVLTGAHHPSVDPDAAWLYFSGHHVDGWEVERVRYEPDAWPPAPPAAPRFRTTRAPAEARGRPVQGPLGDYSPLPTLAPRYWEPLYREPSRVGAAEVDGTLFSAKEVLGAGLGATTSAVDLVGRHAYDAFLRIYTHGGKWDGGVSYDWARLGNPVLSLGVSQVWDDDGARVGRADETAPPEILYVLERDRTLALSATFRRPRWRHDLSLSLAGAMAWEGRELLDETLEPSTRFRLTEPTSRIGDVRATLSFSTARSYAFNMGGAQGVSAFVRGRLRRDLSVADSLSGSPGRDRSVDEVLGRIRLFQSLDGPGFAPHVLGLRGSFGYARGPDADAGYFEVGGAAGSRETVTGLTLFGGVPLLFPVRGYPRDTRFGRFSWTASLEYRLPLALVNEGLGAWPLHVDRILASVFADAGNAWGPDLDVSGFRNPRRATLASVGAEVTAQILTFWTESLRLRLGVAQPLVEGDGTGVYLRLGLSF